MYIYRLNRYQTLADDAVCFLQLQTTAAFIEEVLSELSQLPGFDIQDTCLWDWMHTSPLGIEGISNGAVLLELVLAGHWGTFGGPWKVRIGISLKRAFTAFKAFCARAGLEHSQQQFNAASLGVAGGQFKQSGARVQPVLKAKAHNMMCVTRWLAEVLHQDNATSHRRGPANVRRSHDDAYIYIYIYIYT